VRAAILRFCKGARKQRALTPARPAVTDYGTYEQIN
jgi:hypothetical protein